MAVSAISTYLIWAGQNGILVTGDNAANQIYTFFDFGIYDVNTDFLEVRGGGGDDTIIASAGVALIFGGEGNDLIGITGGSGIVDGGAGFDMIFLKDPIENCVFYSEGDGVLKISDSWAVYTVFSNVEFASDSNGKYYLVSDLRAGLKIPYATISSAIITLLPAIAFDVSPASVAEDGASNLLYTFTRTGDSTNALTVNYGITGTADSTDYTGATPGTGKTITFVAGSATAILTIDPTADTTVEADETVVITLAAGTGYTVGTTTEVVGMISNDDITVTPPALTYTPVTTLGSVVFQKTVGSNRYSVAFDGVNKPIAINGTQIYEGMYACWS